MPARTDLGMSVRSAVKNRTTRSTTQAMVKLASCVRPFSSSRIWVLVGLPLTTKVPLSPAAKFAPDSPTMSRLTSTFWPFFMAKLREVAALWAMISTKQENAMPMQIPMFAMLMPCGSPIGGKPPWTDPTMATPSACASMADEMPIDSTTATIAPGTLGTNRLNARMMTIVPSPNARVGHEVLARLVIHAHCCWNQLPVPLGMPRRSGICPVNTCTPTPVRKPMSTEADRKSPMKPSLKMRARMSITPQMRAIRLV